MRIATAIVEAGSRKFSYFPWGDNLVETVNANLDGKEISLETTGDQLDEILSSMPKQARKIFLRLEIEKGEGVLASFGGAFDGVKLKNRLIVTGSILLMLVIISFSTLELSKYKDDKHQGASESVMLKGFEHIVTLIGLVN